MRFFMLRWFYLPMLLLPFAFCSCQESLEDRAEKDAREFTRKYCPTPVINFTRTDSVVFNKVTRRYTYYCSFTDRMDDMELVNENKEKIKTMLDKQIKENTSMKTYREAGFIFQFVCHSDKDPNTVLLETEIR